MKALHLFIASFILNTAFPVLGLEESDRAATFPVSDGFLPAWMENIPQIPHLTNHRHNLFLDDSPLYDVRWLLTARGFDLPEGCEAVYSKKHQIVFFSGLKGGVIGEAPDLRPYGLGAGLELSPIRVVRKFRRSEIATPDPFEVNETDAPPIHESDWISVGQYRLLDDVHAVGRGPSPTAIHRSSDAVGLGLRFWDVGGATEDVNYAGLDEYRFGLGGNETRSVIMPNYDLYPTVPIFFGLGLGASNPSPQIVLRSEIEYQRETGTRFHGPSAIARRWLHHHPTANAAVRRHDDFVVHAYAAPYRLIDYTGEPFDPHAEDAPRPPASEPVWGTPVTDRLFPAGTVYCMRAWLVQFDIHLPQHAFAFFNRQVGALIVSAPPELHQAIERRVRDGLHRSAWHMHFSCWLLSYRGPEDTIPADREALAACEKGSIKRLDRITLVTRSSDCLYESAKTTLQVCDIDHDTEFRRYHVSLAVEYRPPGATALCLPIVKHPIDGKLAIFNVGKLPDGTHLLFAIKPEITTPHGYSIHRPLRAQTASLRALEQRWKGLQK